MKDELAVGTRKGGKRGVNTYWGPGERGDETREKKQSKAHQARAGKKGENRRNNSPTDSIATPSTWGSCPAPLLPVRDGVKGSPKLRHIAVPWLRRNHGASWSNNRRKTGG